MDSPEITNPDPPNEPEYLDYLLWLCYVRKLCCLPGRGYFWEWLFVTIPAPSREALKQRSCEEFQIWEIYDCNRINRCAIAERHGFDRSLDPYNCHVLEL